MPEQDVRGKRGDGDKAFSEFLHVSRQQPHPCKWNTHGHHEEQGRQYPSRPSFVEVNQTESAFIHLRQNDGSDQVTADDKKDVHTDIATPECFEAGMVQDDRNDSDGSQAIYL